MACAPGLYRAIRSIYRDSEVLFSTSSVKQKWSKKLTQMNVKEPSIRLKVEKTLAEMRSTMDYDKLVELWQNIDNQFPSEIKPKGSLKAWLEKWIAPKAADRWAAFNRQELWKIYAEVTLEHWHAELKAKYLRPCKTFNVDDILYTLTSAADACFIVAADKRTKTIPRPMTAIEKIRRNGFTHQMATLAATGTRTTAASNPSMSYDESNRRERAYGVPFEEARRAVNVVDIRRGQVEIESLNWTQSSYNKAVYTVVLDLKELEIIACTCPDFATTRGTAPCKHMFTFERVSGMYAVRRGKALQAAFPTPSTVSMPSSSSTSAAPVARTNTSVGCGKCKNCALNRAVAAIESLQKVHLEGKAKMSADATTATKAPLEDKAKKSVEATKPTSFLMCGFEAESSTSLALAYAVLSGVEASKQAKWTAWRAQQTTRYGAVARARAKLAVALNQLTKGVDSDKKAVDVSSLSDEQLKLLADGMDRIAEWTSKIGPKL
ncbi:hypothetical protein BGZ73_002211 [Actinomortierella ambigua]|nr:hypothetical protein BGZ73_002211 [Actinomortierella ambigua]